jgi:LysR family glycine cleavage system transcriptional activator
MQMRERELPLTALRAFAVAAASENLTTAAARLGVTHGAVSKQIIALEEWLGQRLFTRQGRSLRLTPYGHVLADQVSGSMRHLSAACEYVMRDRARKVVSVEAQATFAMYFLLPRIKEFEALNPGVSVWVSTRVTGQAPDFSRHDIVITRGESGSGGVRLSSSRMLMQEQLTVVSSAGLLDQSPVRETEDLQGHALLASSSRPGDWEAWFAHVGQAGHTIEGGHHFDHLFVTLHAVRDGYGSTIAPRQFFESNNRYALVCPLPDLHMPGSPLHAHVTASADEENVTRLLDWLNAKVR